MVITTTLAGVVVIATASGIAIVVIIATANVVVIATASGIAIVVVIATTSGIAIVVVIATANVVVIATASGIARVVVIATFTIGVVIIATAVGIVVITADLHRGVRTKFRAGDGRRVAASDDEHQDSEEERSYCFQAFHGTCRFETWGRASLPVWDY